MDTLRRNEPYLGRHGLGVCEPIIQHLARTDETRSPSSPNHGRKASMTKTEISNGMECQREKEYTK